MAVDLFNNSTLNYEVSCLGFPLQFLTPGSTPPIATGKMPALDIISGLQLWERLDTYADTANKGESLVVPSLTRPQGRTTVSVDACLAVAVPAVLVALVMLLSTLSSPAPPPPPPPTAGRTPPPRQPGMIHIW